MDDAKSGLDLIKTEEAAALLCVKRSTLEVWRCHGDGPPWVRVGRKAVRYRRSDVMNFIQDGQVAA